MTKADIAESLHAHVRPLSKKEASDVVEMIIEAMKTTLERSEKVKISGFGNFHVRVKKSRIGRNPQTGQEIRIGARRVLTFRASQGLKDSVNTQSLTRRNGRA